MKELGEGSRDMITTMTGWDINPRVLGVVPKEAEIAVLENFRWVTDAQYMAGCSKGHLRRQAGGAAATGEIRACPSRRRRRPGTRVIFIPARR